MNRSYFQLKRESENFICLLWNIEHTIIKTLFIYKTHSFIRLYILRHLYLLFVFDSLFCSKILTPFVTLSLTCINNLLVNLIITFKIKLNLSTKSSNVKIDYSSVLSVNQIDVSTPHNDGPR